MDFRKALDSMVDNIMSMVSKIIENAPFDKTYFGIVKSISGSEITVTINGGDRILKSSITYSVGSYVMVLVPRNNWDKAMITGSSSGMALDYEVVSRW